MGRPLTSIMGGSSQSKDERAFLSAAQNGDLAALKQAERTEGMLDSRGRVKFDVVDSSTGDTALHLVIKGAPASNCGRNTKHYQVAQYLINKDRVLMAIVNKKGLNAWQVAHGRSDNGGELRHLIE